MNCKLKLKTTSTRSLSSAEQELVQGGGTAPGTTGTAGSATIPPSRNGVACYNSQLPGCPATSVYPTGTMTC